MTRQNVLSKTIPLADEYKVVLWLKMRCENCDFPVLGNVIRCCDENDHFEKQHKPPGEGVVSVT